MPLRSQPSTPRGAWRWCINIDTQWVAGCGNCPRASWIAAHEDPLETARRELQEEAGLAASDWRVLLDSASSPGFSDESVRIYLATGLSDVDRPDPEGEEADLTLDWFALEDAVKMALCGEIVNSSAAAGVLAAYASVIDGKPTRPVDAPWPDRPTAFARRRGGMMTTVAPDWTANCRVISTT